MSAPMSLDEIVAKLSRFGRMSAAAREQLTDNPKMHFLVEEDWTFAVVFRDKLPNKYDLKGHHRLAIVLPLRAIVKISLSSLFIGTYTNECACCNKIEKHAFPPPEPADGGPEPVSSTEEMQNHHARLTGDYLFRIICSRGVGSDEIIGTRETCGKPKCSGKSTHYLNPGFSGRRKFLCAAHATRAGEKRSELPPTMYILRRLS